MKLVTPPLNVEKNDGFSNDALGREDFGIALLNLVVRSSDELVISLDGQWGEGKTTFVQMWQGLLNEQNVPNIYIDAFSNDYVDDAFISVASAITIYAEKYIEKEHDQKIKELKETTKKVGIQLLSWTAKVGIKAATLGAIKEADIGELTAIKEDLAKGTSEFIGKYIEEKINSHAKDVELIQSFKTLLSDLPSKLQKNENKPLIIIIDELDRCKPTFAIEILEKIKHLFSVKNVVFVLVMNTVQLEESIRCVYGQNIDAHTYLQKFISLEAKLPKRIEINHTSDLSKYADKLIALHEIETWGENGAILNCIEQLANHFNLSLRQLEKVFTNLSLLYGTSTESQFRIVPIIVFVSVVRVVDPLLFDNLLYQKPSYEEVCRRLNFVNFDKNVELNRNFSWIIDWIRFALISDEEFENLPEEDEIRHFTQSLRPYYSIKRQELLSLFARHLSMFLVS